MLCDKHVPKLVLESAQLLCSPFENGKAPYKRTHYNHPCAIWTRNCRENYWWLLNHGFHLGREYTKRFGKVHKSSQIISWCLDNWHMLELPHNSTWEHTDFSQCMPEQYKISGNAVQAYRNYYIGEKAKFAKWEKGTEQPYWWKSTSASELVVT